MKKEMTREAAWMAAFDAADQHMRKEGRRKWNREDYNEAVKEYSRLWPEERDRQ